MLARSRGLFDIFIYIFVVVWIGDDCSLHILSTRRDAYRDHISGWSLDSTVDWFIRANAVVSVSIVEQFSSRISLCFDTFTSYISESYLRLVSAITIKMQIIVSALLAASGFGIYKRRQAQNRRRQEHLWEILRN